MKLRLSAVAILALLVALFVTPAWSATKPLTVNELAAKPGAHIGKVSVVGRVAAVTTGKGFTLINTVNCATCTTQCPTDRTTKRLPFVWGGSAPVLEDVVVVQGTFSKTAKGFTFTADKVINQ